MANDLGMTSLSRDDILSSFPKYFYSYLQKNKLSKFITEA